MLPLLYLHGLSTSDFTPALEQFLESGAGLSAATITRLTGQWQDEATAFNRRSLAGTGYDGTKELVALADGFRESSESSWAELLHITDHLDVLLAFYDYPTEHWIHLRKTNPIQSTFATVRLRQRVTKGPGSRAAGVARAFELIESAQARWRTVNAPHLVAQVRAGATFEKGKLVERSEESGGDKRVA